MPPRGRLPWLLCTDTDSRLPILGRAQSCTPNPWPACSRATRSAFIIPDDKAYCPEEFKASNSTAASWAGKLPLFISWNSRPASCSLFPLLLSFSRPLSPLSLSSSFAFLLRPYSPTSCFSFFSLSFPVLSSLEPFGKLCRNSLKSPNKTLRASFALILYESHSFPLCRRPHILSKRWQGGRKLNNAQLSDQGMGPAYLGY